MDNTQNNKAEANTMGESKPEAERRQAHYVEGNGAHASARIIGTYADGKVVDLHILGDGSSYDRKTVVYSKEPKTYTWHWPEDDIKSEEAPEQGLG